eukprot:CAMPEP_0172940696 /NCGR_PEP_ID=MMETSP1075-20121228/224168_1 /TAXON_ID=2916 /ORGANISM="Ceratium fusus, Strain PA161109" /LENGTH=398 /DNA_ID=CAMNT_0013802101 /DNA_START=39 /DNA_END=1235 /DNA_ORIENTATION=+
MTDATESLHALDQSCGAAPTEPAGNCCTAGSGCDMLGRLFQDTNLPQDIWVEALRVYMKSASEKAKQARNMLQRAGFIGLLDDNQQSAVTSKANPLGDFACWHCTPPAPPEHPPSIASFAHCTPLAPPEHSPSLGSLVYIDAGSNKCLPAESTAAKATPSLLPTLQQASAEAPQQTSNETPNQAQVQVIPAGTVPMLNSKFQTSEDTKPGATLTVFSAHVSHIVNSATRQHWVSDSFWVNIQGAPFEFRVIFTAKQVGETKKGLSFKKANGWGKMELKCAGKPPEGNPLRVAMLAGPGVRQHSLGGNNSGNVATTVAATSQAAAGVEDLRTTAAPGEAARRMTRREAQYNHDFGKHPTFAFSGHDEFWDFSSLVDKRKQVVFIGIEMFPEKDASERES